MKVANVMFMAVMLLCFNLVEAEEVDDLGQIIVKSTKSDKPLNDIPASISYIGIDDIQLGRQQLGIDESLAKTPGLFMQNRYNFAQDLRISIRGYGSRATFGIRGIRLFTDNIPATLPDGQGGVDSVDIGSLDHIEVVRGGPSSYLYGASSGGAINMFTEDGPAKGEFVEARTSLGSYQFRKHQVKMGGQNNKLNYLVNVSKLSLDGYRDHSRNESTLLNSKIRYDFEDSSDLTLTLSAIDSPLAEDPGGLTRVETAFNTSVDSPTEAQRNNLRFNAKESIEQQKLGLVYRKSHSKKHEFTVRNYYVLKNFEANLPFGDFSGLGVVPSGGIVELDRFLVGGGGQYAYTDSFSGHKNKLIVGMDVDLQRDERVNFTNVVNSSLVGPKSLDQDEHVSSLGAYLIDEFNINESFELTAGARFDKVDFDFSDSYLDDATDDSGEITFTELSSNIGLLWRMSDVLNAYGSVGTSFEAPTTRELANPDAAGGFNKGLDAQTALNYEIGIKGFLSTRNNYQLTVFRIETDDELVLAGQNAAGSNFFENAGKTTREGVEAAFSYNPLKGLNLSAAYTYSNFRFKEFSDGLGGTYYGNRIPGIPKYWAYTELTYFDPSGFHVAWNTQFVESVYVDNANSDAAEQYAVSNFRLGHLAKFESFDLSFFFGINNIFNKDYIGAVRVNEANGRFFEPAPDRNVYTGLSLRYN